MDSDPLSTSHNPLLAFSLPPTRNNLPYLPYNIEIVLQAQTSIWNSDVGCLLMMDQRDFNKLGVGIDDLIDGYIQTLLSAVVIDRMACQLVSPKGTLRRCLFKSLNDDPTLPDEIMR
ncbi:MAG: hypothetical protein ACPG8W_00475 [Candidatus Promineifilaceae bacterium]